MPIRTCSLIELWELGQKHSRTHSRDSQWPWIEVDATYPPGGNVCRHQVTQGKGCQKDEVDGEAWSTGLAM